MQYEYFEQLGKSSPKHGLESTANTVHIYGACSWAETQHESTAWHCCAETQHESTAWHC